ncbi:hypothetical protein BS47DRAFT_1342070 [Hydnum rufescens UP504]|uniref:Prokaryotic-type class I peptide chain release factors domain-containing protein n=1 Tax=Hydnum rufescens UP504 TaxID=1448309 RepID=A0A9P6B0P2_9AGAM|nr:hypothetical protein BS47DRAFT_1342070 [Hydnum rufescens UP504]
MYVWLTATRRSLLQCPRVKYCIPTPASVSTYGTSAIKGKGRQVSSFDISDALEQQGARVLRVVKAKVDERQKLLEEERSGARDDGAYSTPNHFQRAVRLKDLEPVHREWETWQRSMETLRHTMSMLPEEPDPSMRALIEEERDQIAESLSHQLTETIPSLLIPASKTKLLSAIMELKAGAGGDEASLFLSEILRMYTRLATSSGFRPELVASTTLEGSKGPTGGIRDAILEIKGKGSYDVFRWESGVHRVQRVPATETQGRTHTSTVAVVVLPSSDEQSSNEDLDIVDPKDVRTEVMRSRGAGGQHVNKTESAIRLTHEPTGITVSMQDSRSQHQNRTKAWQILRARLLDRKMTEEIRQQRETRRDLVRSADRSEKVRTYNFPQDRLTDHRINYSVNNLAGILEGDGLEDVINELQKAHEMSLIENLLPAERA